MPEFAYGGTITFDPNYSLNKKNNLIEQFHDMLAQHLGFSKEEEYYLKVSKEYHKVDGENDPEAPHLHFILIANKKLPAYRVRAISEFFKVKFGRSQFYPMTTMKTNSYSKYILKDVEKNDEHFKTPHYYEMNLEQALRVHDFEDNIYDDLDYD